MCKKIVICRACGTRLSVCPECGETFVPKNSMHIYCRKRCVMRKRRREERERSQ